MNFQPRLPLPEPPQRFVVFRCSPSEHRQLARILRRHGKARDLSLARHHAALAKMIQERLEAGTAWIDPSRVEFARAIAALAARGML
jgi:hypothetical protein